MKHALVLWSFTRLFEVAYFIAASVVTKLLGVGSLRAPDGANPFTWVMWAISDALPVVFLFYVATLFLPLSALLSVFTSRFTRVVAWVAAFLFPILYSAAWALALSLFQADHPGGQAFVVTWVVYCLFLVAVTAALYLRQPRDPEARSSMESKVSS